MAVTRSIVRPGINQEELHGESTITRRSWPPVTEICLSSREYEPALAGASWGEGRGYARGTAWD